jgi:TonB family protein
MKPTFLLLLLITTSLLRTAPAAESSDAFKSQVQWKLSLDADGKITELAPLAPGSLPTLRKQIEPVVRTWHFTPGKVNGQPAPTETTLSVGVMLDPANASRYHGRITGAATGPMYRHVVKPTYPERAKHFRHEGGVMLWVDFDGEGRVTSVENAPKMGTLPIDSELTDAAIEAVRQWAFRPEVVAGRGTAGKVLVPVCFQMSKKPCQWNREPGADPASNAPIALTSAVGLDMGSANQMP